MRNKLWKITGSKKISLTSIYLNIAKMQKLERKIKLKIKEVNYE